MERRPRRAILVFSLLLIFGPAYAVADFTGSGHVGGVLTQAEWDKVCAAIACLDMVDDDAEDGLNCMKGENRRTSQICREDGIPGASFAITDGTKGKSGGDMIHLSVGALGGSKFVLAGILAHEYQHILDLVNNRLCEDAVLDTGEVFDDDIPPTGGDPDISPDDREEKGPHTETKCIEERAINRELRILRIFKDRVQDPAEKQEICDNIDFLEAWLATLCWNAAIEQGFQGPCPPNPANCPSIFEESQNRSGAVICHRLGYDNIDGSGSFLWMRVEEEGRSLEVNQYPIPITFGQDMVVCRDATLPRGGWGVIVTGTDASGKNGRILGLEVMDGTLLGKVFEIDLPGVIPQTMANDFANHRIFILDTGNRQILTMTDSNGDLLPDHVERRPFATKEQFPVLSRVNSIFVDAIEGTGGALRLSTAAVDFTRHLFDMDDRQVELWDDDQDNIAERATAFRYKETVRFMPTFEIAPADGDTRAVLHGAWGMTVEVREADTGLVLGRAIVNREKAKDLASCRAVVRLSRPLVQGEVLELTEVEHTYPMGWLQMEVSGPRPRSGR